MHWQRIRSLTKCEITSNADTSEDDQVNIRGLKDYKMPLPEKEFYLETSSEEDNDDQDGILTEAFSEFNSSSTGSFRGTLETAQPQPIEDVL